jgi:flavin-dependent dehydrogenase
MADVVIAGGGIAGSTLAILLGRRGLEVEVYERAQFPREKPCGEGLMPAGVAVLERMGLGSAAGGAAFCGVRYHFGERTAEGRFPAVAGLPAAGRGLRRKHFDALLLETAARTPGVRVVTGARVEGSYVENGRVAGIVVEGEAKRARLTVAADGAHSRMRHALGLDAAPRRKRIGMRAHFRLAEGKSQPQWVDVFARRGYELYVTPLPERELLVAGLAHEGAVSGPLEKVFEKWWRNEPELAARLESAERVTPLASISPLAGRARKGVAPGVVLLGDAAGFLDPITGGGMTQALMAAELLAERYSACARDEKKWLEEFDRERAAMLRDYRWLTAGVLWLSERPRLGEWLLAGLQWTPGFMSHLIGVSGGVRRLFRPGVHPSAATPRSMTQRRRISSAARLDAE